MTERSALYRHFDKEGCLLYVGISLSAVARFGSHVRGGSPWVYDTARIDIEWYDTRHDAEAEERKAIIMEKPIWNVRHANDDHIAIEWPSPAFENRIRELIKSAGQGGATRTMLAHAVRDDSESDRLMPAIATLITGGEVEIAKHARFDEVYRANAA